MASFSDVGGPDRIPGHCEPVGDFTGWEHIVLSTMESREMMKQWRAKATDTFLKSLLAV